MKKLSIISILAVVFLMGCKRDNSNAQFVLPVHSKFSDQLNEYFNALLELEQFNGVVLVEKEGGIILRKAYNLKENANESLFVTTGHQFDLRSISKLIAKYSLYKMESNGLLSTEDTIDKFIDDFPNGDKITLYHLMYNQSGLPREFADEKNLNLIEMDPEEIVNLIKKESLEFEPGSETQYSNLGFQLVYYIIGQIHAQTFAQYVQDEVYDRLGMKNSGAHFYTDQNNLKDFARYHIEDDGEIVNIKHHEKGSKKQAKLFSTLDDLNILLHEFSQKPFNKKLVDSNGVIGHSGGSDGIRSHIQTNIEQNYSFVFLANYDEIPFSAIVKTIENILEEKPYEIPQKLNRKSIELSEAQIKNYLGTYDFKDANHITFEFKYVNGSMFAYQNGELDGSPFYAENDSLFFWDPTDAGSVEFQIDENGNYKAIMDMFGAPWVGTKVE